MQGGSEEVVAYCLFPRSDSDSYTPASGTTAILLQHDQPPLQEDPISEILTPDHRMVPTGVDVNRDISNSEVQTQLPIQATKESFFLEQPPNEENFDQAPLIHEDTNFDSSPTRIQLSKLSFQGNNLLETAELEPLGKISNGEIILSGSSVVSGPQFCGNPAKFAQDPQIAALDKHDHGDLPLQYSFSSRTALWIFAEVMAIQEAYARALFDPNQSISLKLVHQSIEALKIHYALAIQMSFSGNHPANTIALGTGRISGSSQIQHSEGIEDSIQHSSNGLDCRNSEFQLLLQKMKNPMNHSMRLIHIKGHVPAFSADPFGSRFIQQKLDTATTEEITMLYEEIMLHIHTLVIDVFANYAIQKLLEHGSAFYKRIFISNLMGHVLDLSLHMYGCRVIQKAFEISDLDKKIAMAQELGRNLVKCVRDQNGNHVVQKCLVCVPAQYIRFIYKSFCGKAKTLSAHPYGCRVIQKVLDCCDDPEILGALVSEIVQAVSKLSADQFGNYVVQHILKEGGPPVRSIITLKFVGRIVHMSCQKYSSNVIEKCLVYGSYEDRQLIANEILCAGDSQTSSHLVEMMINQYANYVIQKVMETADEWQCELIVDVVRGNASKLSKYSYGRHVIAQADKFIRARERRMLLGLAPPLHS